MAILLVAEHDNTNLSEQTAKTLSACLQIGDDIDILVSGDNARSVAEFAARLSGVRRVRLAGAPALAERLNRPQRWWRLWRESTIR
jgi:electron transfer flavoprotein alpha subunit